MERRVLANGWWAMEAADEHRLLDNCGDQKGSFPISNDKWWMIDGEIQKLDSLYKANCFVFGSDSVSIIDIAYAFFLSLLLF